ncbi:MAG TPA: hypothetical protein VL460_03870 [Caulobacteraceae bacterium]|jgi:hypothetical protein|nr:hypothetical protein [Caulobacteraceae bacterium]
MNPVLRAIPTAMPIRKGSCALTWLEWQGDLRAEFSISAPDDPCWFAVRVSMPQVITARVLDEFLASVSGPLLVGLDQAGFAYEVENGELSNYVPEAVKLSYPKLREYYFLSLTACLNVLSEHPPSFQLVEIVPADARESEWPERRRIDADTDHLVRPADPSDPRLNLRAGR